MVITTSNEKRFVDVGSESIWKSVLSTVEIRLNYMIREIPLALKFLNTGTCNANDAFETARQFNLIRDALSQIPPREAIYDKDNLALQAPWIENLSGIVTSCGNLYTTSDGKDLLYEVVAILTYAHYLDALVLTLGWTAK